jgi:hypothetical protein
MRSWNRHAITSAGYGPSPTIATVSTTPMPSIKYALWVNQPLTTCFLTSGTSKPVCRRNAVLKKLLELEPIPLRFEGTLDIAHRPPPPPLNDFKPCDEGFRTPTAHEVRKAILPTQVFRVLCETLENTSAAKLLAMSQTERQFVATNIMFYAPHTLYPDNLVLLLVFALHNRRDIEREHLTTDFLDVGSEWYEDSLTKLLLKLKREMLGKQAAASFQILEDWEKLKKKVNERDPFTEREKMNDFGGKNEELADSDDELDYYPHSASNSDGKEEWDGK